MEALLLTPSGPSAAVSPLRPEICVGLAFRRVTGSGSTAWRAGLVRQVRLPGRAPGPKEIGAGVDRARPSTGPLAYQAHRRGVGCARLLTWLAAASCQGRVGPARASGMPRPSDDTIVDSYRRSP